MEYDDSNIRFVLDYRSLVLEAFNLVRMKDH